jgi:hypothetical protein
VSVWKKLYMIYDFFIARRIVGTFFTLFFFSILIPLIILFPEAQIPLWELIYIPTAIIFLNSVGTPRLAQFSSLGFMASTTSTQIIKFAWCFETRKHKLKITFLSFHVWNIECTRRYIAMWMLHKLNSYCVAGLSIWFYYGSYLRMQWHCIDLKPFW